MTKKDRLREKILQLPIVREWFRKSGIGEDMPPEVGVYFALLDAIPEEAPEPPLWEGLAWVRPDGAITDIGPAACGYHDWRQIKVREVRE